MPLPTGDVIGLMIDNLKKRKTVLPISVKNATGWAKGLDIPRGGEQVIYTGSMYQLLPYIIASVRNLEHFEDSYLGNFVFMARYINRFISISRFMGWPSKADVLAYSQIVRNAALLLKQAGVGFSYLYESELYSGALAYDMGVDSAFEEHARKVYGMLKENGVTSVITVDPHTTNMMRSVYPTFINGYDIRVRSYLEVLADLDMEPITKIEKEVMVHDSCVYARYENVIEEPRKLLALAGYKVKEPKDARELTHCCGGPIESIFPKTAHRIGAKRIEQLKDGAAPSVTMCPICLATLKKAAGGEIEIDDISGYLAKAFLVDRASNAAIGSEINRRPERTKGEEK